MQQDKIWDYFQNEGLADHNFPKARPCFMLRYLEPGLTVLNIGVGSGALERLGLAKGVEMYALDPSMKAIQRLRDTLDMGTRAQAGHLGCLAIHRYLCRRLKSPISFPLILAGVTLKP